MNYNYLKYHSNEILWILYVCASDLNVNIDEDAVAFAEEIEGRPEILFQPEFLVSITDNLNINESIINKLGQLSSLIRSLYSPQWHKLLQQESVQRNEIRTLAKEIIEDLNVKYVDPFHFGNNHLHLEPM